MSDAGVAVGIETAAGLLRSARYAAAFTGAGISVESGIPAFRGEGGLWSRYDPRLLELGYFRAHPQDCWPVIRRIFYDHFGNARPNRAHEVLAAWEAGGLLRALATQNIDGLHHAAGSRNVAELHGNSRMLACLDCGGRVEADPRLLEHLPPRCPCGGVYKPDFVFFGEALPTEAWESAREAASRADVMLVIGSTGEVYPAALIPQRAAGHGAVLIEVNPEPSSFTDSITDVYIPLKAGQALDLIERKMSGG